MFEISRSSSRVSRGQINDLTQGKLYVTVREEDGIWFCMYVIFHGTLCIVCYCVTDHGSAVNTYLSQGCKSKSVNPRKHGIAYQKGKCPVLLPGEPMLGFPPLEIDVPERRRFINEFVIDESARVNYGKLHQMNHDTEITIIGRVKKSLRLYLHEATVLLTELPENMDSMPFVSVLADQLDRSHRLLSTELTDDQKGLFAGLVNDPSENNSQSKLAGRRNKEPGPDDSFLPDFRYALDNETESSIATNEPGLSIFNIGPEPFITTHRPGPFITTHEPGPFITTHEPGPFITTHEPEISITTNESESSIVNNGTESFADDGSSAAADWIWQ